MKKLSLAVLFSFFLKFSFAQCIPATAFDYLDINNVKARINNGGDMWWDMLNDAQYIVPKTGIVSSMFAGALWIGGVDGSGQLHVAAQTYRQNGNDFFPGPLDQNGTTDFATCQAFDRIWKINKSAIDSFVAGQFTVTPTSILEWPARNNPNMLQVGNRDMAPFIDVNNDSTYNPADGDYPDIEGDQALWFVFNDNGGPHSETFGAIPMVLEVQCMAYEVLVPGNNLNNATFYHYKLIYKNTIDLNETYVGLWTDPDLGCYTDDFFGCDSAHNLGIVYNSDLVDGPCQPNYGSNPPILGIDFLKGPVDDNSVTHRLDFCMLYYNDFSVLGNPENGFDYYNYLHALWKDSTHMTHDGNGYGGSSATNYAYPGDPGSVTGWSECSESNIPADKRMILASGAFTFHAGDVKTLDFAVLWDNDVVYPCPSFAQIKNDATIAETYFNTGVITTGVNEIAQQNEIVSFPNPFSSQTTIHIYSVQLNKNSSLAILDVLGRDVSNQFGIEYSNDDLIIDRFNVPAGVYLFSLMNGNRKVGEGKLVVE